MPTPFTHLVTADEILAARAEPEHRGAAELRRALEAEWPAFLLGTIAPDVQTVSGQPREATHFFPVPLNGAPPSTRRLFELHPQLAPWERLPRPQAVFLAGYLAHLVFDQDWIAEIFEPAFGPAQRWGTFRERLYLHNALRAHWDEVDLARLTNGTAADLDAAAPAAWLPFVEDQHLRLWRDEVADQLGSGYARTVDVFAQRMNADPAEFAALLASPEAMERRVFAHVSPDTLGGYRARAVERSAAAIRAFWRGELTFHQL